MKPQFKLTRSEQRPRSGDIPQVVTAQGLTKRYVLPRQKLFEPQPVVTAVDDVSFSIANGTTFGLVGESGSGKTTVAKMLLRLEAPTQGKILVDGRDIFALDRAAERSFRGTIQAVLQDPYGALSPRLSVGRIVGEPLVAQRGIPWSEAIRQAGAALELVGLRADAVSKFPHEFSGGQRQRIAIARALTVEPKIIVLDESVSALDVSVRAQILKLLEEVQRRLDVTYLFIGHDLAIVRYMSRDVGVMYLGKLVEIGSASSVFAHPLHPYTRQLLAASSADTPIRPLASSGDLPSPLKPPSGCRFHTRCAFATDLCITESPAMRELRPGQRVACHHAENLRA